ncbi:siderochrome-iron transporter MirB [Penicillium angulare]|uniref:siderochrome-iron transporter MirB n=1 Tax=Penicillium angulare TaxID=116970 RepID=UPI00253F8326|nr:siderochrome-iron transporter MirB [Penicillium angulare]KAJ5272799.1 siderochrome-iron transporter MirB [Penicillium angulare]
MAIRNRIRDVVGGKSDNITEDPSTEEAISNDKEASHPVTEVPSRDKKAKPTEEAQNGVQKIEAVTLAWSKNSVYIILGLIWLLTLANNMKGVTIGSLSIFATADFSASGELTVVNIVASSLGSAVYIPMAKALDIWGRAEGFLLMLVFATMGMIILAASRNLATYCAGYVFYTVGFGGLGYSWDVLAADVTNLRNRGLAFAFTSSPALISAFAGSKVASGFYEQVNWRWGYGAYAIIIPVFALPIYFMLSYNFRKAEKTGVIVREKSKRKLNMQTVWWIINEFDLLGVLFFASGLVIFLLPFTLAARAPHGWATGYIIAMLVVGFVLLVLFALYEIYVAPVPFLNHEFLVNRTILGACLLDMTYQISYYCYASYLSSFLMVVYNVDLATAGYITNTFSACSFFFLFTAGFLIRWTGRFKWILWISVPLYIFGLGLMIHFRQPGGYIGYIVMCEIFFSASGAIFILCCQLAVLAEVDHQHVASVLSLLFVMGGIGDAVGSAICGAIWTNTFYKQLEQNLPAATLLDITTIYSSYAYQIIYPWGDPTREAIIKSYGYAQPRMLAAGTAFMVLGFIWVAMIKNPNVKHMSQTKGNVF